MFHLTGDQTGLESVTLALLLMLLVDLLEEPFTIVHVQLVLESVTELILLLHLTDTVHECILQVLLGNGKALHLLKCLILSLSLDSSLVECLVLLLDARDLSLDLLLPLITLVLQASVAAVLEPANFVQFSFLLDLKESLLHSFS